MGFTVITSAAGHHRIARGRDWLKARAPAEEILIIGATLGAANELARSLAQEKRASFGYHRLTFGQLASALARPVLAVQRTVPLGALGIQGRRKPRDSLPTTLQASESDGGSNVITFQRIIVMPDGQKYIEGVTPKQLPPASDLLSGSDRRVSNYDDGDDKSDT